MSHVLKQIICSKEIIFNITTENNIGRCQNNLPYFHSYNQSQKDFTLFHPDEKLKNDVCNCLARLVDNVAKNVERDEKDKTAKKTIKKVKQTIALVEKK